MYRPVYSKKNPIVQYRWAKAHRNSTLPSFPFLTSVRFPQGWQRNQTGSCVSCAPPGRCAIGDPWSPWQRDMHAGTCLPRGRSPSPPAPLLRIRRTLWWWVKTTRCSAPYTSAAWVRGSTRVPLLARGSKPGETAIGGVRANIRIYVHENERNRSRVIHNGRYTGCSLYYYRGC